MPPVDQTTTRCLPAAIESSSGIGHLIEGEPALSIAAVVVVGHLMYGAVFAPHLATNLGGYVTSGPTEQLFPGVPNQLR